MTMDPYGQWMGTPMDDREIDSVLTATGWGVITLADADEPYSIPISFGYDGEAIYFVFIEDSPDNRKLDFIGDGKTARLLVTDIDGRFDWQSIAVTGPVRTVAHDTTDWETLIEVLDENAWFSADFERADGIEALHGWRLEPREIRGLEVRADE
jgi:nitroimidazol reductase NimA-like FMN-containing flavoprotein (pyridoxamine 5'-phosphate oxidase superfamily)